MAMTMAKWCFFVLQAVCRIPHASFGEANWSLSRRLMGWFDVLTTIGGLLGRFFYFLPVLVIVGLWGLTYFIYVIVFCGSKS